MRYNLIARSTNMLPLIFALVIFAENSASCQDEDPAVTNLRNYLRIPTAHPNPYRGYEEAVEWLREQAEQLGLDFNYLDLGEENEFACWMTWNGSNPTLKSILLHSHMDVVAADPEKWTHHPFEAHKDSKGNIFGRGAVDMKSYTVGALEAIRKLKKDAFQPVRNIHVLVMPDEEKLGFRGAKPFVKSEEFANLNVGVDLDEGDVNPESDTMGVTVAEKSIWQFNITARGEAAHGSTFPEFTAGQRLQVAIDRLLKFREEEYKKLENPEVTIEQLTVVNLVRLGGGLGDNIIPSELWASFDLRIRINPNRNFTDVENMLMGIVEEARLGSADDPSSNVSIHFIAKNMETGETVANDSNVWWALLQNSCTELNIKCPAIVNIGVTDGRYIRDLRIPAFGIAPFLNTPDTVHHDDEWINQLEFLKGIDRYATFIRNFANMLDAP